MTSPAATPPPAPARFRPAPTPGRRALAVLASAASVAVTALFVAVFAFFISNGQSPQVFGQLFGHFALAALIVWVLLAIANSVGATKAWFLALISGFAAACLASLLATTVTASAASPLSGAI